MKSVLYYGIILKGLEKHIKPYPVRFNLRWWREEEGQGLDYRDWDLHVSLFSLSVNLFGLTSLKPSCRLLPNMLAPGFTDILLARGRGRGLADRNTWGVIPVAERTPRVVGTDLTLTLGSNIFHDMPIAASCVQFWSLHIVGFCS